MAHTDFYLIINSVISRGGYDLSTVLNRIDTLWAEGKIQDDERDMLTSDARDKAAPQFDYSETIQDILTRLYALEEKVASGSAAATSKRSMLRGDTTTTATRSCSTASNTTALLPLARCACGRLLSIRRIGRWMNE